MTATLARRSKDGPDTGGGKLYELEICPGMAGTGGISDDAPVPGTAICGRPLSFSGGGCPKGLWPPIATLPRLTDLWTFGAKLLLRLPAKPAFVGNKPGLFRGSPKCDVGVGVSAPLVCWGSDRSTKSIGEFEPNLLTRLVPASVGFNMVWTPTPREALADIRLSLGIIGE